MARAGSSDLWGTMDARSGSMDNESVRMGNPRINIVSLRIWNHAAPS